MRWWVGGVARCPTVRRCTCWGASGTTGRTQGLERHAGVGRAAGGGLGGGHRRDGDLGRNLKAKRMPRGFVR